MSSSTLSGLTEPPYWTTTAGGGVAESVESARMNACTLCAMAGVAVRPVPIAHTGSYAMTTRPDAISAAETEASAPASCAAHTSLTKPSSYCALDSPTQITGLRPASRIARVLSPTISSVSPNNSRRSEWPTRTNSHPTLAAMAREVSPVYAPEEAWYTFWHPSATPEPFRMAATGARKGAGGQHRTSLDAIAAPPSAFAAAATSAASVSASASVPGFIFQFPAMSGRRVGCSAGSRSADSSAATASRLSSADWKMAARGAPRIATRGREVNAERVRRPPRESAGERRAQGLDAGTRIVCADIGRGGGEDNPRALRDGAVPRGGGGARGNDGSGGGGGRREMSARGTEEGTSARGAVPRKRRRRRTRSPGPRRFFREQSDNRALAGTRGPTSPARRGERANAVGVARAYERTHGERAGG